MAVPGVAPTLTTAAAPAVSPYAAMRGELRLLRRAGKQYYLLTINFETSHFANGLTLTENVARCIVNRLLNASEVEADNYLPDLAYYPEYEPFVAAPGRRATRGWRTWPSSRARAVASRRSRSPATLARSARGKARSGPPRHMVTQTMALR